MYTFLFNTDISLPTRRIWHFFSLAIESPGKDVKWKCYIRERNTKLEASQNLVLHSRQNLVAARKVTGKSQ